MREESDKRKTLAWIGIGLIVLSGLMWFFLFAIPFLPLTVTQRAVLAAGDFVGVQIAWWTGAVLAGPQTVRHIKAWFGKKKNP